MIQRSLFFAFVYFISAALFAQNIYISHRDYSGSPTIHTLSQRNQSTGSVLFDHAYTTAISGYSPGSLSFSSASREIVGITGNLIVFYHVDHNTERSFTLTGGPGIDYGDLVVADNRLFITKRDYSGPSAIHYIQELNPITGDVIGTPHTFTTALNSYSPQSLIYHSSSNQIIGIIDGIVVKYNITSQAETSFTLSAGTSIDYGDIVTGNDRLFVTKRDYSGSSTIHYLVELNPSSGAVIGTPHTFTTSLNSYSPGSLTYLSATNEILGIADNIVVRYAINSDTENSFILPAQALSDYGDIVAIDGATPTAVTDPSDIRASLVIVKAWNLVGEPIPTTTVNQVMIVEYTNGSRQKIYKKAE